MDAENKAVLEHHGSSHHVHYGNNKNLQTKRPGLDQLLWTLMVSPSRLLYTFHLGPLTWGFQTKTVLSVLAKPLGFDSALQLQHEWKLNIWTFFFFLCGPMDFNKTQWTDDYWNVQNTECSFMSAIFCCMNAVETFKQFFFFCILLDNWLLHLKLEFCFEWKRKWNSFRLWKIHCDASYSEML